jgi:glycosyltransferase involved in cell wall biosynthesis
MRTRLHPPGVNLVGFHNALLGLGQTARAMHRALLLAGIPTATVTYRNCISREVFRRDLAEGVACYDTNLICLNADQLPKFSRGLGRDLMAGRQNIGVWFWETEKFPESFRPAFELVDEIWVASEFVRRSVATVTDTSVRLFPHPVEVPAAETGSDAFRFDDRTVFLTAFDFLSDVQRKNPAGAIDAYCKAFPKAGEGGDDPLLVIKSLNADLRPDEAAALRRCIGSRHDIEWIDGYLSPGENAALAQRATALVALHRSEGFGLHLAESMAHGVPVIATGYSGNMQFMDDDCAFLCRARSTRVGERSEHYPAHHRWGEPDIGDAAKWMQHLRTALGQSDAARRASVARRRIAEEHSPEAAAAFLRGRLVQQKRTVRYAARFTHSWATALRSGSSLELRSK